MVFSFASFVPWPRAALLVSAVVGTQLAQSAAADVHGQFDYPAEAFAVFTPGSEDPAASQMAVYEVTIPVSFRTVRGNVNEVEQIEVVLTLDDELQVVDYAPRTSLATDVVGEIEEKRTTEDSRNWGGSVATSIPIPGVKAAQIGPSANISDSERTVRTATIHRRPKLDTVVVAGTTARGKGVFFQLRPGPEITLEGAHHFTLRIAAPREHFATSLTVKCRATANENWILFDRKAVIAGSEGHVKLILAAAAGSGDRPATPGSAIINDAASAHGPDPSQSIALPGPVVSRRHGSIHHLQRPCPWCDEEE